MNRLNIHIETGIEKNASVLTEIAFEAKRYWNYPEEYIKLWEDELTVSSQYIAENTVIVAKDENNIIGFCSIIETQETQDKEHWLDHFFIRPKYIGKGIGTMLLDAIRLHCMEQNISSLLILSDPNARGFYEKIGASYIKDMPSRIKDRSLPLYQYFI